MSTYKVIQDIEAEDKLLGPLSLRQFIYAVIVAIQGFIAYKLIPINWLMILPFLPTMILFTVLAAPFGRDQPSEVWLLAKIRFSLKPRRRIWDQSGLKQLVTITVPKRPERQYTNGLSQIEVKSRLRALADTIDSRGWAVKNVNVNLFGEPSYAMANSSDRLIGASSLPQEVPNVGITASDDIMDAQSNPVAVQLDQMMMASAQAHRQQAMQRMQATADPTAQGPNDGNQTNDYWFMHQPDPSQLPGPGYAVFGTQTVAPGGGGASQVSSQPSAEEQALLERLHAEQAVPPEAIYGHMRVIDPNGAAPAPTSPQPAAAGQAADDKSQGTDDRGQATSGTAANPAILELAHNDDLNVATIAREADRARKKQPPTDEVVVSLH